MIVALLALGVLAAGVYRHIPAFGLRLPSFTSFGKSAPVPLGKLRFPLPPPDRASYMSSPAISPDGRLLAFSAVSPEKKRLLWIRHLSSVDATPLEGTEDALAPFWSPDSKQIGFFAGKKLKKIAVDGGSPVTPVRDRGLGGRWLLESRRRHRVRPQFLRCAVSGLRPGRRAAARHQARFRLAVSAPTCGRASCLTAATFCSTRSPSRRTTTESPSDRSTARRPHTCSAPKPMPFMPSRLRHRPSAAATCFSPAAGA